MNIGGSTGNLDVDSILLKLKPFLDSKADKEDLE
jgi:hypothetical protein